MPLLQEAERTVLLVNPRTPGIRLAIGQYGIGVPTALGLVGSEVESIKKQAGFKDEEVDIRVVDENQGQFVDSKPGNLVLTTAFSLMRNRVRVLIQEAREQGALVVVGGIDATVDPDNFTDMGAISFMGEAGNSQVFRNLIKRWLHTGVLEQGIRVESEGIADPKAINLAGLPVSAEVHKLLDKNRLTHSTFATVGCARGCGFCTVMGGKVVRKRPVEEIVAEIKLRGLDKTGFTLADSDLGAGGSTYLHRLLEELAKIKIPRAWNSETTIECLDRGGDLLFDALARAQCHRLFVGIESPNAENLQSVGKKHNLKYDANRVREIVESAHKRGIKITGLFMVGFLTETVESIRGIEDYIKHIGVDDVNIFMLSPLPGTDIWREFAGDRLFDPQTLDTDQLDLRHLLFEHPLGNELLVQEYKRLCNQVFAWPTVFNRSLRAFLMSMQHNLPISFERKIRNAFGTAFFQADLHRGTPLIHGANKVYEAGKHLYRAAIG